MLGLDMQPSAQSQPESHDRHVHTQSPLSCQDWGLRQATRHLAGECDEGDMEGPGHLLSPLHRHQPLLQVLDGS